VDAPAVLSSSAAAELAAGLRGTGAAGLAAALRTWAGPASALFAALAGADPGEVTVDVWHRVDRTLTKAECALLLAPPLTGASERHARLYAGQGRRGLAADVTSLVIPARLPASAATDLQGTVPLGLILAGLAVREPLGAVPYMGGVSATARLWIGDLPAAVASEYVQPWICRLLERRTT
jgi:hypothetical protein